MNRSTFNDWAEKAHAVKCLPLYHLKGRVVGIDAHFFLNSLGPEGVLSALGGSPLSLGAKITDAVTNLRDAGLELHFVFNGLDHNSKSDPFAVAASSAKAVGEGFSLYDASSTEEANKIFKTAGPSNPAVLTRTCQRTLKELGVPFTVAPYSAIAQLAYYEKHHNQFVDAVYGPSELFCFGVDKLITKLEQSADVAAREKEGSAEKEQLFWWIDRRTCLERLGNIPIPLFIDALLISGSNMLATYPPLTTTAPYKNKSPIIKDAVDAIGTAGGSVPRLCAQNNDPMVKEAYLDQYKRAIAGIRHHVVMTEDGAIAPMDKDHLPSDIHDIVGLRLPEELYMYLSRGMIQPHVLKSLTSGAVNITIPIAGGDSELYRNLVQIQLDPLRRQAITLLAEQTHRYYQTKEISTRLWFDRENEAKFNARSFQPSPRETSGKWHVKDSLMRENSIKDVSPGSLSFAVRSLSTPGFAKKTSTGKPKAGQEPLASRTEVLSNAIWRLLQLRGYISEQHQLTYWGKVLETAFVGAGPSRPLEEAALLAIELLRFKLLSPDTMFENYGGAPINGTAIDKRNCMLVSRVACLGKIRHQAKPYSGPLSRHLLAYQSIISNIRSALRDLFEMILVAMFLEGSVNRERDDWMELSTSLPLYEEHSCALGNLTLHYLDELCTRKDPTAAESRKEIKELGQKMWISKSQFSESLDDAFHLWDAVYAGIKKNSEVSKETALWDEVNEWLFQRR